MIRTGVMMYVKSPLSLRNVEDLLVERGIDICHETVRLYWNRFGPMFAAEIRRKRVQQMRAFTSRVRHSPITLCLPERRFYRSGELPCVHSRSTVFAGRGSATTH